MQYATPCNLQKALFHAGFKAVGATPTATPWIALFFDSSALQIFFSVPPKMC
jgi:hypothetical protein